MCMYLGSEGCIAYSLALSLEKNTTLYLRVPIRVRPSLFIGMYYCPWKNHRYTQGMCVLSTPTPWSQTYSSGTTATRQATSQHDMIQHILFIVYMY